MNRRGRELRERAAALAVQTADLANEFASILEAAAQRGDTERRLRIARREREVAAVERRNPARLRHAGSDPVYLEHLPSLEEAAEEPE